MIKYDLLLPLTNEETERKLKLHMEKPEFTKECSKFLKNKIMHLDKAQKRPLITFCIGTDRSTGDCLGPLVGWILQKKQLYNQFIYGTIDDPVHAKNMEEKLKEIYRRFNDPIIIAIDACLGKMENIGYVNVVQGSFKPGAVMNKNLPEVGDISISGVINVGGFMEYLVLQNTRLSLVMQMAEQIAEVISEVYPKTNSHFIRKT